MGISWTMEEEIIRLHPLPEKLLEWYRAEARDLPWRDDPSPYRVWISEIMLQQTRIEAVKEYFYRFMRELPDLRSLAEAEEERVLKLWEGLGYYSRARNLQKTARICEEQYGGVLPADVEKLLALPGIGPYTAGAIGSIAFQIPVPAVDGNVLRIMARILTDGSDMQKEPARKKIRELLAQLMPQDVPGQFNQALMELGERICIPVGAPACAVCPVSGLCRGKMAGEPEKYPVKTPKKERRIEDLTILLAQCGGRYALRRRPKKGLLAGLYELPSLPGHRSREEMNEWLDENTAGEYTLEELAPARHVFSHVEWSMTGWKIHLTEEAMTDVFFADAEEIRERYPLPTAFQAYRRLIEE